MKKNLFLEKLKKENANAIVFLREYTGETATGINKVGEKWVIQGQSEKVGMPLTVSDLISALDAVENNERLYLCSGSIDEILYVVSQSCNKHVVYIETEKENDMEEEISSMFQFFLNKDIDELDGYMELLDIGITVDMVRKYIGDDHANHMQEFCEEHGLMDFIVDRTKVFKVRLEHIVEFFVRAKSEEEVSDWLCSHTLQEAIHLVTETGGAGLTESYVKRILCECRSDSVEDITI